VKKLPDDIEMVGSIKLKHGVDETQSFDYPRKRNPVFGVGKRM